MKKLQNGFNTSLPIIMPDNAGDKTTSRILFPFLEDQSRPRTRSASKSENSPAKEFQPHKPSSDIRRSMRKLFDDTTDAEITLKSPVKIPPEDVDDTFKTPTKLRPRLTTPRKQKSIYCTIALCLSYD